MERSPDGSNSDDLIAVAVERLDALALEVEGALVGLSGAVGEWRGESSHTPERVALARDLALASARARRAVTSAAVMAAGAAELTGVARDDAERTTRVWLARHTGVSRREAASLCRGATALRRFPEVEAALTQGDIAPGHVDALAGIIPARLRGSELAEAIEFVHDLMPTLLETAGEVTVDDFERFCDHVRARLDQDGPPDRSGEPSRVWLSKSFEGRYALTGDLSADDGAILKTALLEVMARLRAEARREGEAGSFVDPDADYGQSTNRPGSQHMADALRRLVIDGAGATKPGRVGVFLHVDLDDLHADVPRSAHTEANLDITDETLWRLLEGGDVTPVFNTDGSPLCFGRTRRLAPPIMRRVLAHRDRRCRFAWCDQPSVSTQGHHLDLWDDGGSTDPENMAATCAFHHQRIHRGGWTMSGTPPDVAAFRPDGTAHLDDQQWRGRQRARRAADRAAVLAQLRRERRRLYLRIAEGSGSIVVVG